MTAIVLDCETSGFDPATDRMIELAIFAWDSDSRDPMLHSYFNPEKRIDQKIVELTGVTNEIARMSPLFREKAETVRLMILSAEAVIGYNVAFDRRFIDVEMKRAGLELKWPILVDALRIWDVYEPKESRNLQNAYRRFVAKEGFEGAHGAVADTRATRDVLQAQFTEFNLHGLPWDQLDPERKSWWGPTRHIVCLDGVLTMNFGKHESRPVDEIDVGFWSWLVKKDFPDHVTLLAIKMIEFIPRHRGPELRRVVSEWGAAKRETMT